MDINNDLQQINTFVKGMNTDVSDALMDSSQYRYAENVRLTTNTEENTGELRLVEGTASYANLLKFGKIVAMTSIRDILIVVTELSKDEFGKVRNLIVTKDDYYGGDGWNTIFDSGFEGSHFTHNVSLVTRWESEKNVKLYIADGAHGIISINIRGLETDSHGVVIPITNIDDVSSESNICLDPPTVNQIFHEGGSIEYVKVQYAYRLYKIGGITTLISPLSEPISLYKTASEGFALSDKNTGRAILINIPLQDTFEYLEIYRIGYVAIGQQGDPRLIYDNKFITSFKDTGGEVAKISNEEFKSLTDTYICPTVIESKGDYLFAANIKDFQQETDEKFDIDFRAYSSGNIGDGGEYVYNKQFDNINNYDELFWKINNTDTIGGECQYISWQFDNKDIYIDTNNRRYRAIDDFPNNPIIDPKILDIVSLRPGEVYRYGAVLYLNSGKKTSTKWIADIMVPPEYNMPERIKTNDFGDSALYKFKRIGINFNINWGNIPEAIEKIEIVRAERTNSDKITITQGICGYTMEYPKGHLTPLGLMSINKFVVFSSYYFGHDIGNKCSAETQTQYLNFATPEYTYAQNSIQNLVDDNVNLLYILPDYYLQTPMEFVRSDRPINSFVTYDYLCRPKSDEGNITNEDRSSGKTSSIIFQVVGLGSEYPSGWDLLLNTFMWTDQYIDEDADPEDIYNSLSCLYESNPWYPFFLNYVNGGFGNKNRWYTKTLLSKPSIFPIKNCKNEDGGNFNISTDILSVGYAESQDSKSLFDDNKSFMFYEPNAQSDTNGGASYTNWTATAFPDRYNQGEELYDRLSGENVIANAQLYPIGSNGRCMILKTKDPSDLCDSEINISNELQSANITAPVISLKRKTASPYNRDSLVELLSYVSFGNTISDGTSLLVVYDGDCYPGIFVYTSTHAFDGVNLGNSISQVNIYTVPLYSEIDLSATSGWLYNRKDSSYYSTNEKYLLQDKADVLQNFELSKDMYEYRTEYGASPNTIEFSTITYSEIEDSKFDTRVFHSELKENNERADSWLHFKPKNFIDVDSRFGQITNLRLFKDRLLFWQEHAIGVLSVNERTVLNDIENNDIVVGTGGTLQRYDYISTIYGMKPYLYQAEVLSNTTQYWWDGYNKEILAYSGGMELIPITKIKNITNYINKLEESESPMLAYDTKYDEVLAQVVGENTVVYNEQILAFSSVYTFMPLCKALIENDLYLAKDDLIYIWNKHKVDGYSYLFDKPVFPKVRIVVNKNNIYTKTFDNLTFGGRMYKGSLQTIANWLMERVPGEYVKDEHLNSPMHHLTFTFETPLKLKSAIRGDKSTSVDEYDYRLAIPRNGSQDSNIEYGNRMRGKTMQCEIASDYNSTDFSLQYITTKFRMSWG